MIGFTHGILLVFKNSSRASRLPRVDACQVILEQWILCIDCNSYLNEDAKRFKFDCIKGGGEIPFAGLFQDLDLKKKFDVAHFLNAS